MRSRKGKALIITVILFGVTVMISCTHKPQGAIPEVSFTADIIPIFKASCAINGSCHLGANNANDEVNLDSSAAYATIISKHLVSTSDPAASLLYYQVSSGTMPKAPYEHLSQSQITLILDWIQQGALSN